MYRHSTELNQWRYLLVNFIESLFLLSAMASILAFCAYLIWGETLMWIVLLNTVFILLLVPKVPASWIMQLHKAQQLDKYNFPDATFLISQLTQRAKLSRQPKLFYIRDPSPNAFSVGSQKDSAIAITDGLLKMLDREELVGVLAHEIAHISHNDLWIMTLAHSISRLTSIMVHTGIILLFLNLPFVLSGKISWVLILVLILSPSMSLLLQLTLSRSREYYADFLAAKITGYPLGLASALNKIHAYQCGFWHLIFFPGKRHSSPSLLRTHPATLSRIRRLQSLAQLPSEKGFHQS